MKKTWTLLLFFLLGCSTTNSPSREEIAELQSEYNIRLEQLREESKLNLAGWPADNECDGALWAGIARAAGASWVDISAAVQPDGRPTRMPFSDCGPGDLGYNDGSASTISNDMMTGIMLGILSTGETDSAKLLWDYGYANGWVMGYPKYLVSRVILRPNGIALLAGVLYRTSKGTFDYAVRLSPVLYGPVNDDFEEHLLLIGRYLQRQLGGPQYGAELAEKILASRRPSDALAQAIAGESGKAARLLLSNYKSPSYVRGHPSYHLVHWLIAARIVLDNH